MERMKRETLFLKYEFSDTEKLDMAGTLARNHNEMDDIETEEQAFKAQMKNRRAGIEMSIQTLSRNISSGFEMRNVPCRIHYDDPHVGAVSFYREDNGELAKVRAMTEQERQMELPIVAATTEQEAEESADASAENIANFFDKPKDEQAVFTDTDPSASTEATKPEHDAAWEKADKPKRGRPRKVVAEESEKDDEEDDSDKSDSEDFPF